MRKIELTTAYKKLLSDVFTPVGIYLRLRDRFRDTILLESSDYNSKENSYSFIGINAIAGIEISSLNEIEVKYPNEEPVKILIDETTKIPGVLRDFLKTFSVVNSSPIPVNLSQGLFGYTTYDAVRLFDNINFKDPGKIGIYPEKKDTYTGDKHIALNLFSGQSNNIPMVRYRLYQYIIVINHFKSELFICENKIEGIEGDAALIESIIRSKDIPEYPFLGLGIETSSLDDEDFKTMLKKGIESCTNGEISRIFLSRGYTQKFTGDELNVYRALRNIIPGPYLFYFDYGDYRLFGSGDGMSFERINKEDLSENSNPYTRLADNYPTDKLIGVPKEKAIELIEKLENETREHYCGSIGFVGFDESINHASMVRSLLSKDGQLKYRAGIEITTASNPENQLKKVTGDLKKLRIAIQMTGFTSGKS